jgi:ribonuclease P protein component
VKNFESLKGRKIFREVLRKGRRIYEKEIQLIVYAVNGSEEFLNVIAPMINCLRLGIQVDRKYGNSVKRNLAKRRIKAVCGEILPVFGPVGTGVSGVDSLKAGRNFFIIIRPLEAFKKLKYEEIKKLVALSFKKAGLFGSARL